MQLRLYRYKYSTSKYATTEGTLTAPSFIGISGSSLLTQLSAAPQGDRTHATTASELHVVPSPHPARHQ